MSHSLKGAQVPSSFVMISRWIIHFIFVCISSFILDHQFIYLTPLYKGFFSFQIVVSLFAQTIFFFLLSTLIISPSLLEAYCFVYLFILLDFTNSLDIRALEWPFIIYFFSYFQFPLGTIFPSCLLLSPPTLSFRNGQDMRWIWNHRRDT